MAELFQARVCSRSLAGIADSNPAGVMDVCVVLCCKVIAKVQPGQSRTDKVQRENKIRISPGICMSVLSVILK